MTAVVLVVVLVVVAVAYRTAWRWTAGARPASRSDAAAVWARRQAERTRRREQARRRRLPPLPADDAPPAGLPPLVPSPRTMRVEAARGIRELEAWLQRHASA